MGEVLLGVLSLRDERAELGPRLWGWLQPGIDGPGSTAHERRRHRFDREHNGIGPLVGDFIVGVDTDYLARCDYTTPFTLKNVLCIVVAAGIYRSCRRQPYTQDGFAIN
ncbi:hypothetical protein [Janthinobacterium sp. RA13]|uniref:hypothetical protein n=1 Tax=Janthinobacterium sp. RA13 TaxID=1502762 RepID=UPI00126A1D06|nr:hypothetical protein [Janthinobacterium sp. RA13]